TPKFNTTAVVLIKDNEKGGASMDAAAAFSDLGVFQSNQNINNEIEVLRGKSLMFRVLKELNLETSFFTEGKIKRTEIYGESSPVCVTISRVSLSAYQTELEIEIEDNNNYNLIDKQGISEHAFGKKISKPYADFTLTSAAKVTPGERISIKFNNL